MKCSKQLLIVVFILFALLQSLSVPDARDASMASQTFAAAQTTKQKCMQTCRDRYRDCRSRKEISSFECRGVYQDCTRYTCTGLGPG
jgi:hypothetical protein